MTEQRRAQTGRWHAVKVTLAVAHSIGVILTAIQIVETWVAFSAPGPRDPDAALGAIVQGIALGILGLPWSIGVFVVFADSRPAASAWAVAHAWVPSLMFGVDRGGQQRSAVVVGDAMAIQSSRLKPQTT